MAFTKTPEQNTHSTKRIAAVGSPFLVPNTASDIPTTLNYYNCFPTMEKQFGGDPKYYVQKREPYTSALSATTGSNVSANFANWCLSAANDDNVYFARDNTYYYAQYSGSGSVSITSIGTYTSAYLTAATLAINSSNERRVVAANGTTVNTWLEDGSGFTTTAITPSIVPTGGLVFLNGYLFAIATNRNIYNSGAGGVLTTWNTTNFIDAELFPDMSLYLGKHRNHLVVFGESSTEFFFDAAVEVGSPLSRQETYASRIGAHIVENQYKALAYINDDIYFIAKTDGDVLSLGRVKDFKVETIENNMLSRVLNSPTDTRIYSIETWTVNNIPMILIKLSSSGGVSTGVVYNPETESWWTISLSDIGGSVTNSSGDATFGNQVFNRTWNSASVRHPFFFSCASGRTSATINVVYPDKDWGTSVSASIWTDLIDCGVNRLKHVYKAEAVGMFGSNVLTLSVCDTPIYDSYAQIGPTQVQSTLGARNNVVWNNLGQWRIGSLKFDMVGAAPANCIGFELGYNMRMT